MYDLLIRGGRIVDGTGNPWFYGDVALEGGKIACIGPTIHGRARRTIDAGGLVVAPGFIDTHSHSDLMLLVEPQSVPKIMQGITTEVLGQDGIAPAPVEPEHVPHCRKLLAGLLGDPDVPWNWQSLGGFLDALDEQPLSVNVCTYVPYGNIRLIAMNGSHDRLPTADEMQTICSLVRRSLQEGAFALSTGLVYPPCCYAESDEMVQVQQVLGQEGSFIVVHGRNEGSEVLASVGELVQIASAGGAPLHISHLKVAGKSNWHKRDALLEAIDEAREDGIDVTFDQYPYTAGSTMLSAILPPWAHSGGSEHLLQRLGDNEARARMREWIETETSGWENMADYAGWDGVIVSSVRSRRNERWVGRSLEDIGAARGVHPADAAMDLMLEEDNAVGMITHLMSEPDVATIMRHPSQMVCTDGILGGKPHPRVYGSYPRVLGRYVREEGHLTLEDAVRRMTSFPAQRLGLTRRGMLRTGFWADMVLFDFSRVRDRATYENPRQFPEGIATVIVNGEIVVQDGKSTQASPGKVLRAQDA